MKSPGTYKRLLWLTLPLAMLALVLLARPHFAGEPEDPFSEKFKLPQEEVAKLLGEQGQPELVEIPRGGNEIVPKDAVQPEPPKKLSALEKAGYAQAKMLKFDVRFEHEKVDRGGGTYLIIHGTPLQEGVYTYAWKNITKDHGGPLIPTVELINLTHPDAKDTKVGKRPTVETPDPVQHKTNLGLINELEEEFTWKVPVQIKKDATPGTNEYQVKLYTQICKDTCIRGYYPNLTATLDIGEQTTTLTEKQKAELDDDPTTSDDDKEGYQGLIPLLISAFFGALLMLITPCVFPMIPITVNFFLKQSEKEHYNPLLTAGVYSGTIILLLSAVILLFGSVVIQMANNPWFNLALGAVLIYFAFSLFGMYDVELPSFLTRFTSSREGQGGVFGAIFMALTFTITSFTCTGPFLGILMAPLATFDVSVWHLILAALVYSTTFAAPFFVLALFPSLLKSLPKSGGWLNVTKVTMGFLELGAALKFLANTDIALNPGNPWFFNYDTVVCAWIALSVATGLYLLGFFRLPHDSPIEHVGVPRMVFATIFLGLAFYMSPLLWGTKPAGVVGNGLIAFLPPNLAAKGELHWHKDYEKAIAEAKKTGKPILIDYTGVNCTNCRSNEQTVFPRSDVQEVLKQFTRLQLYTDVVPNPKLNSTQAKQQADRNTEWMSKMAGSVALPTYVVFVPDLKKPYKEDGTPNGKVLAKDDGFIYSPDNFIKVLGKGLREGKKRMSEQLEEQPKETEEPKISPEEGWHRDIRDAVAEAKTKKLIFIDFTGKSCVPCLRNEKVIFPKKEVQELLTNYSKLKLYTDTIPNSGLSEKDVKKNVELNMNLLETVIPENAAPPTYVIFQPADPAEPIKDGKLNGKIFGPIQGDYTAKQQDFIDFLKGPLQTKEENPPIPTQPISFRGKSVPSFAGARTAIIRAGKGTVTDVRFRQLPDNATQVTVFVPKVEAVDQSMVAKILFNASSGRFHLEFHQTQPD